ncbi:MAG: hypothetical protein ACQEP6_01870 [Patescibacteria group bacterium]
MDNLFGLGLSRLLISALALVILFFFLYINLKFLSFSSEKEEISYSWEETCLKKGRKESEKDFTVGSGLVNSEKKIMCLGCGFSGVEYYEKVCVDCPKCGMKMFLKDGYIYAVHPSRVSPPEISKPV